MSSNLLWAAVVSATHPKFSPPPPIKQAWFFARCWIDPFAKPGSCTSIVVPETKIWGSPTPNASTRLRMFSSACCITGSGVPAGACRMTETPPSRSRPSCGFNAPVANPIREATTKKTTMPMEAHNQRVPFMRAQPR